MVLKLKTKIAYGFTAIADHALHDLYVTFFLFFMTTAAGISPAAAGVIVALGSVWECIITLFAGRISDKTHSKMGKRKPFIVFLAFPMALTSSLMFAVFNIPVAARVVYYLIITMLYWTLFPMFYIPFVAWGAELTEDYDERTSLRSYAFVGNMFGLCISTIFPTVLLDFLIGKGLNHAHAWHGSVSIVSAFIFISLFFGPMMIKSESNALTPEEKAELKRRKKERKSGAEAGGKSGRAASAFLSLKSLFAHFASIMKLKAARYLIFASILFASANSIFASDKMYYFTYNMGISGIRITVLFAIVAAAGVVFVPVVNFSKKYFDKRTQFIAGMSLCAAVMILFRFIGVDSMLSACLFMTAFGIGSMCYWQLMPGMIYDVCGLDELKSGEQRQGTIVSLQSIAESIADGLGVLVLGFILEFAGFDDAASVQSENALSWVENCFTLVPAFLMILAVIMVIKYPITKKNYGEVLSALEKKRNGEEADLTPFEDIV